MPIIKTLCLILCASAASAAQLMELRQVPLTRASIDELTLICERHAKNDGKPFVLLTGLLLQHRYEGDAIPSCVPTEKHSCRRHDWFPLSYTGVIVKTNHYKATQKVAFHPKGFGENEMHSINLKVQHPVAVCALPMAFEGGMPHFDVPRYEMIYQLTPAAQQ